MHGKLVSPLIASLALIIATIVIAAFLANYVTGAIEAENKKSMQCPDGAMINYVSNDYPRFYGGRIEAVVEVAGSPLSGFAFDLSLANGTTVSYPNTESQMLTAGTIGTLKTGQLPFSAPEISSVIIKTNCTGIETGARNLR